MGTNTAEVEILASAIPTLSSLQSLHLGVHFSQFAADAIPDLQSTLKSLPQLCYLQLNLDVMTEMLLKRQREFEADTPDSPPMAPPTQQCLVPLLSSAPGLSSLDVKIRPGFPCVETVARGRLLPRCATVSLTHLRHLAKCKPGL